MLDAVPKRLAETVTHRPAAVLALIGLLTVGAGFLLPHLEMDPSPRTLVSTYGDQEEASGLLRTHFGNTDHVVVVLVEAEDVLTPPVLRTVRSLSRRLAAEPFTGRVESLTETSVAVRRGPEDEVELPTLEDFETLDALEADESTLDSDLTAESLAALEALIEAEPDRFPGGLPSLSEQAERIELRAVGETIDDAEAERLRSTVERVPLFSGRLVSRPNNHGRRRVTAIAVFLDEALESHEEVSAAAKRVDTIVHELEVPEGVKLSVGGLPHLWVEIVDRMASDQRVLIPLTLVVCMLFLWVSFRWWPATLLPIVAVAITAVLALGGMAAAHEPLNVLNNIVPPLLIIIGVSDSIHLIGRYREELRAGNTRLTATQKTMKAMTVACLLTSVTTSVGLASLLVSRTETLQRFGVSAAAGVLIAYVVTILFLPAAILFVKAPASSGNSGAEEKPSSDRLEQVVGRVTSWVLARPWAVLAGGALLAVVAAVTANRITVDTRLRDQFDEADPVYQTTMLLDRELDGVRPLEVLVTVPLDGEDLAEPAVINGLDAVAEWAEGQTAVLRASGPGEALHEALYLLTGDRELRTKPFATRGQIEGLAALVSDQSGDHDQVNPVATALSDDHRVVRLELRVADVGAQATMRLIDQLAERVRARMQSRDDVKIYMTGDAFSGSVPIDSVVRDMLASLGLAVLMIFILLSLLFRSVRLGFLAIPGNALPLVVAIAWMVVRDIPLNIATAIIFSISFGLAVDGTIHVLARFREEQRAGKSLDDALLASAKGTGRAIAVSSAVLMCGFSVLLFSAFVPVRYFGELVAITVASCLVATLVIQPALLKVGAPRVG